MATKERQKGGKSGVQSSFLCIYSTCLGWRVKASANQMDGKLVDGVVTRIQI